MKHWVGILAWLSVLPFATLGFSVAEASSVNIIIGHEVSDQGEQMDIVAGDAAMVELWKTYVAAHNDRDVEAIRGMNGAGFKAWAANGQVIESTDAHMRFLEAWFASASPTWQFKYALANDVIQADGTVQHWVTSAYTVSQLVDGKWVKVEEMYDARIEQGKIKYLLVADRAVIDSE